MKKEIHSTPFGGPQGYTQSLNRTDCKVIFSHLFIKRREKEILITQEGVACYTPCVNVARQQSLSCNNCCQKEECLQST